VRLSARTLRALALAAWTLLFLWLWMSGESVRYLGPRTQWVIPVGAIGLGLAAAGYLRATRGEGPSRLSAPELLGIAGLLVPIVAAAMLGGAQLGSLAASNKLNARGVDPAALARLATRDARVIGFLQLDAAGRDADLANELGIHAGTPVQLEGFVSSPPRSRGGRFELSRFYITCCVADAVPVSVFVTAPRGEQPRRDEWLDVTGALVRGNREWIVRAAHVEHIDAPADPYLSFTT
jgi:putative membrane protein